MRKKIELTVLLFVMALFLAAIVSCDGNSTSEITTYRVTVLNKGSKYSEKEVAKGDTFTFPASPEDTEDETFEGWIVENDVKKPGEEITVTSNLTAEAGWVKYCIVTFDSEGGSSVPSLKIKKGDKINYVTEPVSVKEGYVFSGWKTAECGVFDFSSPIESSMTITAKWTLESDMATVTIKDKSGCVIRTDNTEIGALYTIPDLGYEIKSYTTDDYKIYSGDYVKIEKKNTVLTIEKGDYREYEIGQTGPGGGYIVFDADYSGSDEMYSQYFEGYSSSTLGWRYLEAAPSDLEGSYVFGYYRNNDTNSVVVSRADGEAIGTGKTNTASLVAKMGKTAYSEESGVDKEVYAAYKASAYNGGGYSDWFLPSSKELVMLDLLSRKSIGDIKTGNTEYYWSSTETDEASAESTSFLSLGGTAGGDEARSKKNSVRPFRSF